MRKKKPMTQEQHFDDCGSDAKPFMDDEARTALAMSDPCGAAFWFEHCGDCVKEDFEAYPAIRKWPEGTVFDCDGCRGHKVWHHPSHTRRSEPPGLCRYHDRPTDAIKCPACLSGKDSLDPGHTEVAGECLAPETRYRDGRKRRGGP
eukprot:9020663-Pyramimonas_sp.AAC.1